MSDQKVCPNTEYRQNYTWGNVPHGNRNHSHAPPKLGNARYGSSFDWPKKGNEVEYMNIEPPIVATKVDTVDSTPKIHEKILRKTEYTENFEPFSAYVYIMGNGFKKPKNLDALKDANKAMNWYSECEARSRQANHYKTRSQQGHPLYSEGLTKIYAQSPQWNHWHVDRELQALSLATTLKLIDEKKQEREFSLTPRSGRVRCLSSAPPSIRTEVQNTSNSSIRTKSPQNSSFHPREKQPPKPSPMSISPKPEGKIWLKPKPKSDEPDIPRKPSPEPLNKPNIFSDIRNDFEKMSAPTVQVNVEAFKKCTPPAPVQPMPRTTVQTKATDIRTTAVKSPSPDPTKAPNQKPINLTNKSVDNKYSADMTAIKSVPMNDNKPKIGDKTEEKSKPAAVTKPMASKPTAKVQPSPSTSLTHLPPKASGIQSIDEEVKIVKPPTAKVKAGNVLDKARHRLDHFWSRNK